MNAEKKQLQKKIDLRKMPKNKARVEIAKDVIAALNVSAIQAESGTYFQLVPKEVPDTDKEDINVRDLFAANKVQSCMVCGIGALFVAKVGRLNDVDGKIETREFLGEHKSAWMDFGDNFIRDELEEFFTYEQLELIESAFERDDMRTRRETSEMAALDAADFGSNFDDDHDRMQAIMNNIIANKGEFIP